MSVCKLLFFFFFFGEFKTMGDGNANRRLPLLTVASP